MLAFSILIAPQIFDVINETPVIATVVDDDEIFKDRFLRNAAFSVNSGDLVEILEDYSALVYRVSINDNTGWIRAKNLEIPPDPPTDLSFAPPALLEGFVNKNDFASKTEYLMLVDIARQKLYIFTGEKNNWSLARVFDCSTGLNTSPTTRGEFELTDRGNWFYSHRLASGAKYWIRFNGNYLFHTIPMDEQKNPLPGEDVVGVRLSNGCVRLLVDDMRFIYDSIPDATTVIIK